MMGSDRSAKEHQIMQWFNDENHKLFEPSFSSPQYFQDPLKTVRKVYWILIPLGAAVYPASGGEIGPLSGMACGWAAAYLWMQCVSAVRLRRLTRIRYSLPVSVAANELANRLSSLLLHPSFMLDVRSPEIRIRYRNAASYRVTVDPDARTFRIRTEWSFKTQLQRKHNPLVIEYTLAVRIVPIIRRLIDQSAAEIASEKNAASGFQPNGGAA